MKIEQQTLKETRSNDLLAELRKARGLLTLARRFATGAKLSALDAQRVELAVAETMKTCRQTAHQAKDQGLYSIADSGIDGRQILEAIALCLEAPGPEQLTSGSYPVTEPQPDTVLALLDDYRRVLVRTMMEQGQQADEQKVLRVALLRKIFLQICMVVGIECKLRGQYPIAECDPDPGSVRQALLDWAAHATWSDVQNT